MATKFPSAQDDDTTLPDITNPTTTYTNNPSHGGLHSNANEAIRALEAKVGLSASTPIAGQAFVGTGTGSSTWRSLNESDITNLTTDLAGKQASLTLTTTGTSGAATLTGSALNIPNYAASGGSGTVTSVSVTNANGVSGSVANQTTTPAITVSLGAITPSSVAATGTITGSNLSGTNTGDQTTVSGNAGTATTLATARTIGTLTGDVTSAGSTFNGSANNTNATVLATVNSNTGSFGSATAVPAITVNAKGLTTAVTSTPIQITESQVTNLTTDLAGKQATLSLTTTGTSGAATLTGATLNIPQYAGGSGSGITRSVANISTNTAAGSTANTDYIYNVTATATVTLPTAVGNTNKYSIKNDGSGVTVTVATTSSQTIDGSASAVWSVQYASYDFISDGTNWSVE